jgi:hypothetical protein
VKVLELGGGPRLAAKQLEWAPTGVIPGNTGHNVDGVKHCKWPQFSISDIRPMDGGVMQHGTSDGQYSTNGTLCDPIGVMGSNSRMMNGLVELLEVLREVFTHKWLAIVTEICLCNDTVIRAMLFEGLLGGQRRVGVQRGLELNEHHPSGMVHKDAATHVLLVGAFLTIGVEQTTQGVAIEVVHGDLLTWKQIVPLESSLLLLDGCLDSARCSLTTLLGILTGSAERAMGELGCT